MLLGVAMTGAAGNELPATGAAPLMEAAQSWARTQQPTAPAGAVLLQPTDARMATAACPTGWQFDLPFSDRQAVRGRCTAPRQQVFLRATTALRGTEGRPVTGPPQEAAAGPVTTPERTPSALPLPPASLPPPNRDAGAAAPARRALETKPRQVLTLRQDLRRGATLEAQHVVAGTADLVLQRGLGDPIEDAATLEHVELVRDKLAGQVLYSNDIQPALLVRKGQLIIVTMQGVPGFTITARLEALQDGRMGETIRLRNRDSGRIVSAVVAGPNTARLP